MEFLGSFSDQDVGQRQLEIDPLALEMIQKTWAAMTIKAGDLAMGGGLPRFNISPHIVTETTKGRAFGIFKNSCK